MNQPLMPEIEKVTSLIAAARRLLAENKMVDLGALEGKVKELRAAIDGGAPDDLDAVKALLSAVVDGLDGLEAELTARHRRLNLELGEAVRRQAADAYGKDGA
ncbi:MAG: hypothetical protein IIC04_08865 [Proteobacteria bacterium]|nr:hypothetical protein [Pseudomonadota bacterium]